jgi:hypothetical protein
VADETTENRIEVFEERRDALKRAANGDKSALPVVREYLDARGPGYLEVFDLARISVRTQIKRIVGVEDLAAQEVLRRKAGALREEVVGSDPSPLERLLAERVVICWLQLHYAEQKYAEVALGNASADMAWAQEEWHQKRIDRLQRRYIGAIKGLAQVRKLLKPGIQINVAEQQVNVSGDLGKS